MKFDGWRCARWSAVFLGALLAVMALLLLSVESAGSTVAADSDTEEAADAAPVNPRAEYWGAVRHGAEGYSAVTGPEANVLIQDSGQIWRELRNGPASTISARSFD